MAQHHVVLLNVYLMQLALVCCVLAVPLFLDTCTVAKVQQHKRLPALSITTHTLVLVRLLALLLIAGAILAW